jgi:TRAP-type C4-dicarboxylate transport system permease small subunit
VERLRRHLKRGAELFAALLLAGMFGAFLVQIVSRYVIGRPVQWSQEVALIFYLWIVFWACAFIVRERDHIVFDIVYQALPEGGKRWIASLTTLLAGGLLVAGLPGTWDYITFMAIDRTWVLKIRFDWVFAVFLIFMVAVIVRYAIRLRRLAGRGWREEL